MLTLYKTAWKLTRNMSPKQQCTIALHNLLTITNEIAAVIPGNEDQHSNRHDIVLHSRVGSPFKRISDINPFYPALHYVLRFPTGQMGWHSGIPYHDQEE